jgi:hypothetical protein
MEHVCIKLICTSFIHVTHFHHLFIGMLKLQAMCLTIDQELLDATLAKTTTGYLAKCDPIISVNCGMYIRVNKQNICPFRKCVFH